MAGSVLTPEGVAKAGTEHAHQVALCLWASLPEQRERWPELGLLFAIPNGGDRNKIVAARLKAEGVKPGVPDLMLPVARHDCHGLFLELKRPKSNSKTAGIIADNQQKWSDTLRLQGYGACSCVGWEQARDVLLRYLT